MSTMELLPCFPGISVQRNGNLDLLFLTVPVMLRGMSSRMTQRTNAEVGDRVRARRVELMLTPSQVTEAADVDPKTLQRLEDGTRWPIERSRRRIEPVLLWKPGALDALKDGDEPQEIPSESQMEGNETVEQQSAIGDSARSVGATMLTIVDNFSDVASIPDGAARELRAAAENFRRADELLGNFLSNPEINEKYSEELHRLTVAVGDAFRLASGKPKRMPRVTELERDPDAGPLA